LAEHDKLHLLRPNTGQKSHKKGLSKTGYVW